MSRRSKKTLIPPFSRKREKELGRRAPTTPLPLAGEGRVRVFFLSFPRPPHA
jgi:hypothetical protein